MMEAVAAVGLAGNILAFIDFGSKLVRRTSEFYASSSGALPANAELEILTIDLAKLCTALQNEETAIKPSQKLGETEASLLSLASECQELAQEFVVLLRKLKVKSRQEKWASVGQALRTAWNEKAITDFTLRLNNYRSQIMIRLAELARSKDDKILSLLNEVFATQRRDTDSILEEMAKLRDAVNHQDATTSTVLRAQLEKGKLSNRSHAEKEFRDAIEAMSVDVKEKEILNKNSVIISTLRFDMLESRHSRVVEAHAGTFRWIISPQNLEGSFVKWLQGNYKTYWITGKPGSGKSTLMKFLCDSLEVRKYLQIWAGSDQLCLIHFFFWNPGSDLQKSLNGLLRAVLYHIMRQCPDLIPQIVPSRWNDPSRQNQDWTQQELLEAFGRFKSVGTSRRSFCFFIDGLDEYNGDQYDIIETINAMLTDKIKVCFSSRAWNVFEKAFGDNDGFKLYIHDYTRPDIIQFVKHEFEQDSSFSKLVNDFKDKRYQDIAFEIADRAEGVFLWVFLVVRSLRHGLSNADTFEILQTRLRAIPRDMKNYFRMMLESNEEIYRQEASRIYLICLTTKIPPPLSVVSFYDEGIQDFALKIDIKKWSSRTNEDTRQLLETRIKARCRDLVEVVSYSSIFGPSRFKVEFLHRTARDFLQTKEINDLLHSYAPAFNPHRFLCNSYSVFTELLISNFPENPTRRFASLLETIDEFIFQYRLLYQDTEIPSDELIEQIFKSHSRDPCQSQRTFVLVAIQQGLVQFILNHANLIKELVDAEKENTYVPSLLAASLLPRNSKTPWTQHLNGVTPEIVDSLLVNGASPSTKFEFRSRNGTAGGNTVWDWFLDTLQGINQEDEQERRNLVHAAALCIKYGADADRSWKTAHSSNTDDTTVLDFIHKTDSQAEDPALHKLVVEIDEGPKRSTMSIRTGPLPTIPPQKSTWNSSIWERMKEPI